VSRRRSPKILMATNLPWSHPMPLGNTHLARAFAAAGWDVGYVSSPISPLQVLKRGREVLHRLSQHKLSGTTHVGGRLWAYTPLSLVWPANAPLLGSRVVHREWWRTTLPNAVREVRNHGFAEVDILYVDWSTQIFWMDHIERKASVARIPDLYSGFVGIAPQLLAMERELIRSVDLVVHSSTGLEEHVIEAGARDHLFLSNGVDFESFATPRALPPEYEKIAGPIAVYAGAISEWLDYKLLDHLSEALPKVSFVYIGPPEMARRHLAPRANVHFLGWQPFDNLPALLQHAAVGLMPYDVVHHYERLRTVNSLKLYQYFAAGLPVVATRWPEVERQAPPVLIADTPAAYAAAIQDAISGRADLEAGRRIARDNDWSSRVAALLEATGLEAAVPTGP
jgi:glycosyltransferase involved in cell wall biosynthesis